MNSPLMILNILLIISFVIHTYVGDKDIRSLEPADNSNNDDKLRKAWTFSRGWCHWVSMDLLFAAVGVTLINFTDYFSDKVILLQILGTYFAATALAFLLSTLLSKSFSMKFVKVFQWFLLLIMSGLAFWGANSL